MEMDKILKPVNYLIKEKSIPFLTENRRLIAQFILTALFFALGIWFLKHEQAELSEVKTSLINSTWIWILAGIGMTAMYIALQGFMYVTSFSAIQCRIGLKDTVLLFLKRNLISVFLPAGGVSSLVFFTTPIENKGLTKSQIHYASTIYGFVGILSVIIVAIPAFIYALVKGNADGNEWIALISLLLLTGFLYFLYRWLMLKGRFYQYVLKFFPSV